MTRLVLADASKVSPAGFLRHCATEFDIPLPQTSREEQAERAAAWRECQDAMREAPRGREAYWERQRHDARCSARFAERLAEIEAKYALAPVEHLGPGRIAA